MRQAITAAALSLAFLQPVFVDAAKSTTRTSTATVFLPPRSTGSASNIYASVITSDSSKTEYLLACQTAFSSPYNCGNDFTGVTVTYSASDMDIAFGAATYDCKLASSSAVCATKTASSASEGTTTLNASARSSWMTAITVLDVQKSKTTKKTASETASSDSSVCKRSTSKRSTPKGSNSGSDGDSSSSSSNSKSSKSKGDKGGCSGASTYTWHMGAVGVVGAGLAVAFGL
ncbi:hypothetical protein B0T10DRAFT_481006 [Thelonectria olida]|uniref:Uncharacterized protein n=1 Tax=Thelonectria olida TaxID=1576542 RepID=A0A9P9ASR3_9HYPO|nr:hypothetical protein B0T10DRAFT_481006 [Thelonectria olida]